MAFYIRGVEVAEPAKGGFKITDEPVWNEDAARDVNSGQMNGAIVTWKRTVQVTWPPLTFAQANKILDQIKVTGSSTFFKIKYTDAIPVGNSQTVAVLPEITVYPSNLERTVESITASYQRQTEATVTFIER